MASLCWFVKWMPFWAFIFEFAGVFARGIFISVICRFVCVFLCVFADARDETVILILLIFFLRRIRPAVLLFCVPCGVFAWACSCLGLGIVV